jgi:3-isopropylmalate dehydrogenase
MLTGSLGMLASASIGGKIGLYEPSHGSAPKYAGLKRANPIATILSGAMLLKYSLNLDSEAGAIEKAVTRVLDLGYRTADLMEDGRKLVNTDEMGDLVAEEVGKG